MATSNKPIQKDVTFTLSKDTASYKVVSVLQEQFKSPESTNKDGKVVAPRKLQGRLLIGAIVEAVFQHASPETLKVLAAEIKDIGEGDKKGKASQYVAAIASARPVTGSSGTVIDVNKMSAEERARLASALAEVAKLEEQNKRTGKGAVGIA